MRIFKTVFLSLIILMSSSCDENIEDFSLKVEQKVNNINSIDYCLADTVIVEPANEFVKYETYTGFVRGEIKDNSHYDFISSIELNVPIKAITNAIKFEYSYSILNYNYGNTKEIGFKIFTGSESILFNLGAIDQDMDTTFYAVNFCLIKDKEILGYSFYNIDTGEFIEKGRLPGKTYSSE